MRPLLALHGGALACATAYLAAFALTLVLAAWLTPRHWWRRPTLRGGAVLAGGTLAFGTLLLALADQPQAALAAATMPIDPATPPAAAKTTAETTAEAAAEATAVATAEAPAAAPEPGASYRVAEELNLRASRGVHAARLAVLPAGSRVVASGAVDGDWWQVRARLKGRELVGWTSSLWLRRRDEARIHGGAGA